MKAAQSASAVYSLACVGSDATTLQVEFQRAGDRFSHWIGRLRGAGACSDRWSGVHRDEPEPWPASPPIQELAQESILGRDVLLGVGRAGKCHWSLSVETTFIETVAALRFDIACRCPEQPQWLGSTYRIDPAETGSGSVALWAGPASAASALSVRCERDTALVACDSGAIRIEPTAIPLKWPATVRWRYSILACLG